MPLRPALVSGVRDVCVVCASAFTAIPSRARRSEQRVHRGTFLRRRGSVPQVKIHQSSPVAASVSRLRVAYEGTVRAGSTRTAQALNSAVPDLGSVELIVSRFVATSSGCLLYTSPSPRDSPRSTY